MSKNRKKLKLSAVMALFPLLFTTIPGIAETVIFDSQVQELVLNDGDVLTGTLESDINPIIFGSLPDGVTGTATPSQAKFGDKVTISFDGIPDGMAPELSITYRYGDSDYIVFFEKF